MGEESAHTVLIVDDDRSSREVYRTLLEVRGYDVIVARDGEEAREVLLDIRPHLVLLDRRLPDMDGLELLPAMHSDAQVICVSARAFEEDREEALSAGVDLYLTKPASPREVLAEVEKMLASEER